jgi:hypothetical protein
MHGERREVGATMKDAPDLGRATARLAQVEQELAEERRRSARLQAILDPHADFPNT